ncbi:unnamed protein product, partial [Brassica rapa subsp. trilocularis]
DIGKNPPTTCTFEMILHFLGFDPSISLFQKVIVI